ncbi:hypothetical protein FA10DRAFT_52123 [Acaromyces ingoldii]|uniref:Uncharacterized protein n=1 Tax=Acaromyces ingoldii TaxID=215250 RepID=A0A316YFJ9_9BASI|nr:hypothetical protein FA10DRAFT_52123 [Acaromyces ingoldii]PWN86525.1 hypothetical protein FA10DRAFT_52123 [Acaromyces ingoldii]
MLRFLLVVVVTLSVLAVSGSAASCDVRLWVRADDLHPASVAEGDARLVNNLTSVEQDDCRVASWSLGLRHRERVALKYPLPDVELPAEPKYNYTWESYRWKVQDGEFLDETVFDPHEEERKEYDRKLEEYATAIRSNEHWVIVEEERITFDIMADMGAIEEPREGGRGRLFCGAGPARGPCH